MFKKILLFSNCIIFTIVLIPLFGCNASSLTTPTISSTPISETTEVYNPVKVSISQAPKLGETAELTFTVNIRGEYDISWQSWASLANSRAWLEFHWTNTEGSYAEASEYVQIPVKEILVSGETTWEGGYSYFTLHSTIQLPREGIWEIKGYFTGEGWTKPIEDGVKVAVVDGMAAIMGTAEFKSGPLAYLSNFNYGGLCEAKITDYLNENMRPVIVDLDISKSPRVDEEVTLTCLVATLYDMPDYSLKFQIEKRINRYGSISIPVSEVINGDQQWKGDLKQREINTFFTTIKFPEDGEWAVVVILISPASDKETTYIKGDDEIKINISSARSSFGWSPDIIPSSTMPSNYTGVPGIKTSSKDRPTYIWENGVWLTIMPGDTIPSNSGDETVPLPQNNWIPIVITIVVICVVGGLLSYFLIKRKSR